MYCDNNVGSNRNKTIFSISINSQKGSKYKDFLSESPNEKGKEFVYKLKLKN